MNKDLFLIVLLFSTATCLFNVTWVDWFFTARLDGVSYRAFSFGRNPNKIMETSYQAIKVIYGENSYCLIKKPTFKESDEIVIMR